MEKFIKEEEVILVNKKFFGDNEEHYYDVTCYDGHAEGVPSDGEEATKPVKMTYPKLSEVLASEKTSKRVLDYRGLYDLGPSDITYGDIMMAFGKIVS